jgi:uncharacterized protein (DUF1810 family)
MAEDNYNLQRFLDAQDGVYDAVCKELASGSKTSHWIWFIFPQLKGLGRSSTAEYYGISSTEEATAYLDHNLLGRRLRHCTELVNRVRFKSIETILGSVDALKFRSCITLFAIVASDGSVFEEALRKYFQGERDEITVEVCKRRDA